MGGAEFKFAVALCLFTKASIISFLSTRRFCGRVNASLFVIAYRLRTYLVLGPYSWQESCQLLISSLAIGLGHRICVSAAIRSAKPPSLGLTRVEEHRPPPTHHPWRLANYIALRFSLDALICGSDSQSKAKGRSSHARTLHELSLVGG